MNTEEYIKRKKEERRKEKEKKDKIELKFNLWIEKEIETVSDTNRIIKLLKEETDEEEGRIYFNKQLIKRYDFVSSLSNTTEHRKLFNLLKFALEVSLRGSKKEIWKSEYHKAVNEKYLIKIKELLTEQQNKEKK